MPIGSVSESSVATVLIVDDDADTRSLLTTLCYAVELDVVGPAEDGAAAIKEVVRHRPRLILLDAVLPGLNAGEVAEVIREIVPDVRIVALLNGSELDPPKWSNAVLGKNELDRLAAVVQPLLASAEREEKIQELRTELATVKGSLGLVQREWDGLGETRRRRLIGRVGEAIESLDALAARVVSETRRGLTAPSPASLNGNNPNARRRPRLTVATAQEVPEAFFARVQLQLGDKALLGDCHESAEYRAVIKATLAASRDVLDFPVHLVSVDFLQVGDRRIAVVVLDLGTDWVVGSALIRASIHESLARATLDAVNRFFRLDAGEADAGQMRQPV